MSTQDSTPTPEQRANSIVTETVLNADERDALYSATLDSLRSISQISYYLDHSATSQARKLRKRFEGEMALLDQIGWEPTSTRTRFPISMPAERLQQVIRPLLEYTRDAVASPENTAPRLAEAVLENLDRQATAQILATSDAGDLARSRRPIITVSCYHDVMAKNLTVRLDSELAANAEAIARADGTSLNETIKQALTEAVQRRRRDPKFKARLRRIIEEDRELLERLAK